MGALPKRRISTARQGKRRANKGLAAKQVKHHSVPKHKQSLVERLMKALGM